MVSGWSADGEPPSFPTSPFSLEIFLVRFLGLCGLLGAVRLSPVEGEVDLPFGAGVMSVDSLSLGRRRGGPAALETGVRVR